MRLITPRDTTELSLVSSSIIEDDYPQWSIFETYARGDFVISAATHTVYRSLTDTNESNDPDIEQAALADPLIDDPDPINWQVIGATNRWRMFDKKPSVQATAPDQIQVVLEPDRLIGGLAGFNIDANTVTIDVESQGIERRNLLTFTEQFDNAAWAKSNGTATGNVSSAPDDTLSADSFVENTANSEHFVDRNFSVVSGRTYTFSTHVKAFSGVRRLRLRTALNAGTNSVDLDFTTGALTTTGGASIVSSSVSALPNGWYRVSITVTATGTGNGVFRQQLTNGVTSVYTGDGTSGILSWGAQLEEGALTDYQAVDTRLRRNLLTWTQALGNAAWTKSAVTIVPDVATAVDGTLTADRIVPDSTVSTKVITRALSGIPPDTLVTITFFGKSEFYDYLHLRAFEAQGWSEDYDASFNCDDGSILGIGSITAQPQPSIDLRRDGYYRCSWTMRTSALVEDREFNIFVLSNAGGFTHVGNGVNGILFGGIQFEIGLATTYQRIDDATTPIWDKTVYHNTIFMQDETVVVDWYSYYFTPITPLSEFVITDYPIYGDTQLTLTFDQQGDTVGVGQIVLGDLRTFGITMPQNSGFTGLDFSLVQQDEFGDLTTVRRAATRISEFEVFFDNATLLGFDTLMRTLRGGVAAVWIGDEDTRKAAINYGFYRDYRLVYRTSEFGIVSLQIQGIV